MKTKWMMYGFGFAVLFALMVVGTGGLVMLLWNNLIPSLFAGPVINFGQALGLLVLSRLLVGGFGGGKWGPGGWKNHRRHNWANLSPEDREKMKQRFYGRCGGMYKNEKEEEKSGL